MFNNLSKWDKYPFIFSLGVLPALTIWIIIQSTTNSIIDNMFFIKIVFLTSLSTIIITFLLKIIENHETVILNGLKNKLEKLEIKLTNFNNMIENTKSEFDRKKSEGLPPQGIKPELGWGWENHPLNRVMRVLQLEKTDTERKIDEIKNQINTEKLKLIELAKTRTKGKKSDIDDMNEELKNIENKVEDHLGIKIVEQDHAKMGKLRQDPESKIMYLLDLIDQSNHEKTAQIKNDLESMKKKIFDEQTKLLEKFGIDNESKKQQKTSKQLFIFAALFAIIAGSAIVTALDTFIDPNQNETIKDVYDLAKFSDLISSKPAFVIASYFPLAILFIHGALVFLSTDGAKIISQGNRSGYFFSSLILFMEGVILYYAATAINDFLSFSFWIFILMITDMVWLVVNWKKAIDFQPQWIHFNSSILFFTLCVLLLFHENNQVEITVFAFMLIIFVSRTVMDYIAGWKSTWGIFDVSDVGL